MFLTKAGQIGKALCAEYKKNPLVMETLALLEKGAELAEGRHLYVGIRGAADTEGGMLAERLVLARITV